MLGIQVLNWLLQLSCHSESLVTIETVDLLGQLNSQFETTYITPGISEEILIYVEQCKSTCG